MSGDRLTILGVRTHFPRQREQPQRVFERDGVRAHRFQQTGRARLGSLAASERVFLFGEDLGHIWAEASRLHLHQPARLGGNAKFTIAAGVQQLAYPQRSQLIGGDVVGEAHPPFALLQEGSVLAHPHHHVGVGNGESGVVAGVDLAKPGHQRMQPGKLALVTFAEVEAAQHGGALLFTIGDEVKHFLHARGEIEIDEIAEMVLKQPDHREAQPRGHQSGAPLERIPAIDQGAGDVGEGGRTTDPALFEVLHK